MSLITFQDLQAPLKSDLTKKVLHGERWLRI